MKKQKKQVIGTGSVEISIHESVGSARVTAAGFPPRNGHGFVIVNMNWAGMDITVFISPERAEELAAELCVANCIATQRNVTDKGVVTVGVDK